MAEGVTRPRRPMQNFRPPTLRTVLAFLTSLLILKVTTSVVLGYRDYFPPNFQSDFLHGRQEYFFGAYQFAFFTHIVSGPLTLLLGLLLGSDRFRQRFRDWHRGLGKVQVGLVLLALTPSGLWMAWYAETGVVAAIGFATLAILTAVCVLFGWRRAVQRKFVEHRRWMWRCFLLLCSAVVLRLIGGALTVSGVDVDWAYPVAAWASWLAPLAIYEVNIALARRNRLPSVPYSGSFDSSGGSSLPENLMAASRSAAGISASTN